MVGNPEEQPASAQPVVQATETWRHGGKVQNKKRRQHEKLSEHRQVCVGAVRIPHAQVWTRHSRNLSVLKRSPRVSELLAQWVELWGK